MARVRWLNVSVQAAGQVPATIVPKTAAWDLETDLEPLFIRRTTAHLVVPMQFLALGIPDNVLTDDLFAELTTAGLIPLTTS